METAGDTPSPTRSGSSSKMSPFRGVMRLDPEIGSVDTSTITSIGSSMRLRLPAVPSFADDEDGDDNGDDESETNPQDASKAPLVPLLPRLTATATASTIASASASASATPPTTTTTTTNTTTSTVTTTTARPQHHVMRSRRTGNNSSLVPTKKKKRRKRHRRRKHGDEKNCKEAERCWWWCPWWCRDRTLVRSTLSCMNLVARMLFWSSATASVAAVVWYSYELKNNGTDPHLIAWFSAGAFVLLGFPVAMYGIVMHLANYNQPNVQCYIVRILWMVPLYSIESWLCLRYKDYAIYIETLRDLYESYVLYSFLQFLIQVLGGEESLILMLKDKSPTRGVHMWGLQWFGVKPWLMGQPIRKTYDSQIGGGTAGDDATTTNTNATSLGASQASSPQRPLKRVYWTSPFFVKCKFGVLQYVLLKFVCSIVVMILERNHMYKEGDFTPKGGYLYICILTNLSQCWALYCLIFFYYATKNELASIRPVGKFLSVKALVFFTWWQSVCISMLYQMDLIPHYHSSGGAGMTFGGDYAASEYLPMSEEDALALDELGGGSGVVLPASAAISSSSATLVTEWSAEDVAKGLQDYLICIEMFVAAIVHLFVFSHTEYDPQAVEARTRALNQTPHKDWNKRLGRKWKEWDNKSGWSGTTNTSSEIELNIFHKDNSSAVTSLYSNSADEDDLRIHPLDRLDEEIQQERRPLLALEPVQSEGELEVDDDDEASVFSMESSELNDDDDSYEGDIEEPRTPPPTKPVIRKPGFVKALLDSAIPQDLRDNTVGIIKGDYVVEKKTLLHHAATSDSYDLFSRVIKPSRSTTTSKSSVD